MPLPTGTISSIRLSAVSIAAGATGVETAITLIKSVDNASTVSAASFVVTTNKRFRITTIVLASRGHATATAQITTFNFRINTSGAVTTSSTPILFSIRTATPATALAWDRFYVPIPDQGIEILGNGTLQFGMSANAVYTTNAPTWDVFIVGEEY